MEIIEQTLTNNNEEKQQKTNDINNQEQKEKKLNRRVRTSSANLHNKKRKRNNHPSPTKENNLLPLQKTSKILSQRSLSAKKPGLPQIFSEQRNYSNSLLPISALCWSVTDAVSGQQIYSKMSSEVREMASLTKMMTLYVCHQLTIQYNINVEMEEIIIPRIAAQTGGTSAFLRENEKISLQDLYHALMLPSGNDAAVSLAHHFGQILMNNPLQLIKVRQQIISQQQQQYLAQHLPQNKESIEKQKQDEQNKSDNIEEQLNNNSSGNNNISQLEQQQKQKQSMNLTPQQQQEQRMIQRSYISRFVKEMNKYAQKLGMRNSQFSNPHGLSSKSNRSTCEDLSKLALQIIAIPQLLNISKTKEYQCIIYNTIKKEIRKAEWVNTNKLLWDQQDEFHGIKTGFTDSAGPCLCVYYKDKQNINIELIITVLCCKNPERRFEDSSKLARWAARQLKSANLSQQQNQSNLNTSSQKFSFYSPNIINNNFNTKFEKQQLSKSIVLQQVICNKNDLVSVDKLDQQNEYNNNNDNDQNNDKVLQTFGKTISSFSQINTLQNLNNNSFISNKPQQQNNINSKDLINSPLLIYKKQDRINKFINENITSIQKHHMNQTSSNNEYQTKSYQNKTTNNRGNSEKSEKSLITSRTTIQRDNSARSIYINSDKQQFQGYNILKKHADDKASINNSSKMNNKNTIKIQKIITQNNQSNNKNIINNNNNIINNNNHNNQISLNSTTCQSSILYSSTLSQNFPVSKCYLDNNNNNNSDTKDIINKNISSLTSRISPVSNKLIINTNNNGYLDEEGIIQTNNNLSPTISYYQQSFVKQDNDNNSLSTLLKGGGICYRSEIRDSLKKPIFGQVNSNVNNNNIVNSNINNNATTGQYDITTGGKDIYNKDIAVNLNNPSQNLKNNDNHNIKIFSKSKKRRYIISCLANIN